MTLRLYNTLTRSLDEFEPLEEGKVRVYACGPTIYDYAHVGNYRSFIVYDLLHRYLEWKRYEVRFVMNLTDVDDKTIDAALEEGVSIYEYTEPYGEAILEDARALGVLGADAYPRATEYIDEMIDFIGRLEEKGLAYQADDGSVYFDISAFPAYGRLSRIDPDELRPGARVDSDDYGKDDVRDFALWKAAREQDEATGAAWDSPWGRGRPGWHLECSVMSVSELGETLDVHLGGEDLVFPHHEDEIAQAEGATGKPFVRYWLHIKHLLLEGRKMSKSLGNTVTVGELVEEGHDPAAIRHQLLSAQYRKELNFTREGLGASAKAVQRLVDFQDRLRTVEVAEEERGERGSSSAAGEAATTRLPDLSRRLLEEFTAAMDDDLNSAGAMGALFTFVNEVNHELDSVGDGIPESDRNEALDALGDVDRVLALLELARGSRELDPDEVARIESLVEEREEARARRDFARADEIRDELAARGVVLEDSPDGTRWKVVRRTEKATERAG
ncbi:MAG: cysteine--tRNA ligase [Gemmatimonadota bacterium]